MKAKKRQTQIIELLSCGHIALVINKVGYYNLHGFSNFIRRIILQILNDANSVISNYTNKIV